MSLSLPDSIIDGIVQQSNIHSLTRTELEVTILVDGVTKRNPRWMYPNKHQNITQQRAKHYVRYKIRAWWRNA